MVVDYFSDISPVSLTPSNPLYQLYQYVIGYEVHLYLRAMNSALDRTARLILALDDEDPSQPIATGRNRRKAIFGLSRESR